MLPATSPLTRISCSSAKIDLYDRQKQFIGPATSCFVRWSGENYLVSAQHVFSGRNPQTGLSIGWREPWFARVHLRSADESRSSPVSYAIPLRTPSGDPCWANHTQSNYDIAALKLEDFNYICFVNEDLNSEKLYTSVGDQVFILGYPNGISGGAHLPVWKAGTIASEFGVDLYGEPKFLVDSSTTEGMSGAPVIYRSNFPRQLALDDPNEPAKHYQALGDTSQKFLGIYSGRIAALSEKLKDDPAAAQLGFVWRNTAVMETVEAASRLPATRLRAATGDVDLGVVFEYIWHD